MKLLFADYPRTDRRPVYVLHPVQKKNGKWVGVEVLLPTGYISPEGNPIKVEHDTEEACQKACDIHNEYNGWTKDEAVQIIAKSMNNAPDERGTYGRTPQPDSEDQTTWEQLHDKL